MANQYGVRVNSLDLDAKYSPSTKTYHGIQILFNGLPIGRITNWDVNPYTRDVALIYELDKDTAGKPVDIVPGKITSRTITATRVELWGKELEVAMGLSNRPWTDLAEQVRPFTIMENLYRGNKIYQTQIYVGCWFTDRKEDAWTADGDFVVRASVSITFVDRFINFHGV